MEYSITQGAARESSRTATAAGSRTSVLGCSVLVFALPAGEPGTGKLEAPEVEPPHVEALPPRFGRGRRARLEVLAAFGPGVDPGLNVALEQVEVGLSQGLVVAVSWRPQVRETSVTEFCPGALLWLIECADHLEMRTRAVCHDEQVVPVDSTLESIDFIGGLNAHVNLRPVVAVRTNK